MTFFWETNLFIYLFETAGAYREKVQTLHKKMIDGKIGIVTSTMTLGELQVGPKKSGNDALAIRYKSAISQAASVVSFDEIAADKYAEIRQRTGIRGADAIQLACAAAREVELFVTNDDRLQRVRTSGIKFIVSIETALQLMP